jgi:replication factor C small subunit
MSEAINKAWTERHRPSTLDDVIGQDENVNRLKKWVDDPSCPNLLLAGPAGVGKTASVVAFAKDKYGDEWNSNLIEMNASDERGIDVVRNQIKKFARESPSGDYDFKIIFLDEVDHLTKDAQAALRRTMEQFLDNTRFFLSCNYKNKIIDPIQSRCNVLPYNRLDDEKIEKLLVRICDEEGIEYDITDLAQIVEYVEGDARRAVLSLQSSTQDGVLDEELLDLMGNQIDRSDIEGILSEVVRGNMDDAHSTIIYDIIPNTVDYGKLLSTTMRVVKDTDEIPDDVKWYLISRIGETEKNINEGNRPNIQLMALFSEIPVAINSSIPNYD